MATIHFLGKKIFVVNTQREGRRTRFWITIVIIAWWYSNKFLSLPIILFPFYFILFTCLLVSPCGDYLSAGDSMRVHSFCVSIAFHGVCRDFFATCVGLTSVCGWLKLIFFLCVWLTGIFLCRIVMDRMSVLVLPGRCWQSVCFSCRENMYSKRLSYKGNFICLCNK